MAALGRPTDGPALSLSGGTHACTTHVPEEFQTSASCSGPTLTIRSDHPPRAHAQALALAHETTHAPLPHQPTSAGARSILVCRLPAAQARSAWPQLSEDRPRKGHADASGLHGRLRLRNLSSVPAPAVRLYVA